MPSRRWNHRLCTVSAVAFLCFACSKDSPLVPAALPSAEELPAKFVVSDPFLLSQSLAPTALALSAPRLLVSAAGVEVAYVSLPPQSFPDAISATIRNLTTGSAQTAPIPLVNGGFDPVAVVAREGDELELRMTGAAGAITMSRTVVPKRRPPGVVRTNPPKGATDIAVNAQLLVVFSEPIAPATLTPTTVQLLQGTTRVPGIVRVLPESSLAVEFVPNNVLSSGTTYRLVVTRGIRDTDGDPLEAEVASDFTTLGATVPEQTFAGLIFSRIILGTNHYCGLDVTGLAWCWGDNHASALGVGSGVGSSDTPLLVSGARRYSSLSAGYYATCAIEASTRFAFCWGYNDFGDLGDGTFATRGVPGVGSEWVPTPVANGIRFSSISATGGLTCGVEAVTELGYCWGKGGLIGDGTLSSRSTPTLVGNGRLRFSNIAGSGKGSILRVFNGDWNDASFACGPEADTGFAYCWGRNNFGQLGDGTATDRLVPTLVDGGSRRFSSIDASYLLTCGIELQTGLVYCWGSNQLGQIGDGTTTGRMTPTAVGGGRRFTSISVGDLSCGIEAETSNAYCWGRSNPLPRLVGDGSLRFSSVAADYGSACGVEALTGRAYCWEHRQLNPTRPGFYPPYSP